MNRLRRLLLLALPAAAAAGLTACMTEQLYRTENRNYAEKVSSVLVTPDGRTLVALGQRYHYIFEAPPVLVGSLRAPVHAHVRGSLRGFSVGDDGGSISGNYELSVAPDVPAPVREAALAMGYKADANSVLTASGRLSGKRYDATGFDAAAAKVPLNQTYELVIHEQVPAVGTVGRVALTPLAIAADGAILIGPVALLAVFTLLGGRIDWR